MKNFAVAGRSRSIFDSIPKKQGVVRTQSYLRLESAALGTQGTVDFNLLTNQGTVNTTEKRLAITDNFIITEVGFFIYKVASGSTSQVNTLNTFPNSLVYTGSGEAANLMNLYNGSLFINIDGRTILESWDLMRHYRVGNAQKTVLTAASGTGNAWDASTWDSASYGYFPVTPQITLFGSSKNVIRLNLPASVAMAGTSSSNYATLVLRGFLDQSASNVVG